jgi:topoisomerase-4 subunit A
VLAVLLKKTELKVNYNFNMVAIHEATPKQMGLKDLLVAYLEHRTLVVRRRSEHDLRKARERIHVVGGLIRAVDILDEVIATIRASRNRADARDNLVAAFEFTEAQADAILDLRLHRLTGLQILELREEQARLAAIIAELEGILGDERKLRSVIKKEMKLIAGSFGDDRRTEIRAEVRKLEVTLEAVVKAVDVVVGVTRGGYIRRSSMASFRAAGETLREAGAREGDLTQWAVRTNTTHKVLVLTKGGTCFTIPVHQLPDHRWADPGTALVNVVPIAKDDAVVAVHAVDTFSEDEHLVFVTEEGMVKRAALGDFDAARSSGIIAMGLKPKDHVVRVVRSGHGGHLLVVTKLGQAIRFVLDEVSIQGRAARGVRGIGLERGDHVVTALWVPEREGEGTDPRRVTVFTNECKAKATPLDEYVPQLRAGKGIRTIKRLLRKPHELVEAMILEGDERALLGVFEGGERKLLPRGEVRTTTRDGNAFTLLETKAALVAVLHEIEAAQAPPVEPGDGGGNGGNGGGGNGGNGGGGGERAEFPTAPPEGTKPGQLSLI